MKLFRTLYKKKETIVCCMAILSLLPEVIQAQERQIMLKVSFNDGSNALIEMSEELRMDFGVGQIHFVNDKESDQTFSLADVRKFEYTPDFTAISVIKKDSDPIVHFTADGFTISMNYGKHTCRIFNEAGSTVFSENFDCSLFVGAEHLPSGTIFIQIDRNKSLKFVVR